ncbi:MAG TPA: amidohydrolase family protein [Acetobacteraceae bacterium]|nr:amidohydrolase family protein [Acetobacteraceae bacterium]
METAGLLDLQVNGYAGVDFNDPALDAAALDHALAAMLRAGVTACLPTLITAPEAVLAERLAALDRAVARSRLGPFMVPGFHLEGPFLNPTPGFVGCHPPDAMVPPDPALLRRLMAGLARPVLMLTLAPEQAGGIALVRWARGQGMLVAIGHSAADAAVLSEAAEAGATLSTHLGNALPHMLAKFRNPLVAHLAEDRLCASFIADGIHIPEPALKVLLRAKGLARSVLVTDATAAAAAPPGTYCFAGMSVEHTENGEVYVPGTTRLAGSALRLDQAVRNIVGWDLATPADAVRLAADNPARLLAPALSAHGVQLREAGVTWSDALAPEQVRLEGIG